jgi:hypothetical protein
MCTMPADSGVVITATAPTAFSAFAGKYNQTYGPGAGPSGYGAFAQVGGKMTLYVAASGSLSNYWTFCADLGEPSDICAGHGNDAKPLVVGKATPDNSPTTVTSWQSLATDGKALMPLPGFKVVGVVWPQQFCVLAGVNKSTALELAPGPMKGVGT